MAGRILKPMGYSGILDETFDLYKKNFLLFVGIYALINVPYSLFYNIWMAYMKSVGIDPAVPGGLTWSFALVSLSLDCAAMAAVTWAVSGAYLDRKATILGSYKAILPRIVPLVLTLFFTFLMLSIGALLCCVPGIILLPKLAFVTQVFVLENKQYLSAIRRSCELAKGEWVRVLVVVILIVLFTAIFFFLPGLLLRPLYESAELLLGTGLLALLQGLIGGLSTAVVQPVPIIALVLLYYDVRIRKEGFDIKKLAADMEQVSGKPGGNSKVKVSTS